MPAAGIEEILQQLGSRDPHDAWDEFLRTYSASIFQVIRHFEHNPDDAADCFQTVCENLVANRFHRLRKFKPDGRAKFSTWLRAVVRNLCLDWQRKKFGRIRVFRSVARLSAFDQDVFRYLYQQGISSEECLHLLSSKYPDADSERLTASTERIERELSVRQRSLLIARVNESNNGEPVNLGPELELSRIPDDRPNPETQAIRHEEIEVLNRTLESFPVQDQLLIRLRFEEDMTLEQCARLMDLGNAQRADRRIKEILERLGQTLR